jgi:hypothetical protein
MRWRFRQVAAALRAGKIGSGPGAVLREFAKSPPRREGLMCVLALIREGLVVCFLELLFVGHFRLEVGAHLAKTASFFRVKQPIFWALRLAKSRRDNRSDKRSGIWRFNLVSLRSEETLVAREKCGRYSLATFC